MPETNVTTLLSKAIRILLFTVLFFGGLYFAKSFLAPVSIAVLLALLMLPINSWLRKKGLNKILSATLCVLIILSFFLGILGILSIQVSSVSNDWQQIKEKTTEQWNQVESFLEQNLGISGHEIQEKAKALSQSQGKKIQQMFAGVFGALGNFFLIFIYVFLFILYKRRFRHFIKQLTNNQENQKTEKILHNITQVAQSYLLGKVALIIILAILYTVGLLIVGVKYAPLVAIIAAVLSIIPYIGNMIGGGLAIIMALVTKGSLGAVLGVLAVFFVAQFFESYILTPLIVGKEVELNPLFTIMIVVLGGAIWSIPGMIIAIPYLGICRIIYSNIEPLKPYAELIGEKDDGKPSGFEKAGNWIKEKVGLS